MIMIRVNQEPGRLSNYYGVKEKSLKNGCGFYIKVGINFKPRKDLEITYSEKDNKFECSWSKLLNKKTYFSILVGIYDTQKRNLICFF